MKDTQAEATRDLSRSVEDGAIQLQRAFLDYQQENSVTDALLKIGHALERIAAAMEGKAP